MGICPKVNVIGLLEFELFHFLTLDPTPQELVREKSENMFKKSW